MCVVSLFIIFVAMIDFLINQKKYKKGLMDEHDQGKTIVHKGRAWLETIFGLTICILMAQPVFLFLFDFYFDLFSIFFIIILVTMVSLGAYWMHIAGTIKTAIITGKKIEYYIGRKKDFEVSWEDVTEILYQPLRKEGIDHEIMISTNDDFFEITSEEIGIKKLETVFTDLRDIATDYPDIEVRDIRRHTKTFKELFSRENLRENKRGILYFSPMIVVFILLFGIILYWELSPDDNDIDEPTDYQELISVYNIPAFEKFHYENEALAYFNYSYDIVGPIDISSDGKQIIYRWIDNEENQNDAIWIMNIDGTNQLKLYNANYIGKFPKFSQDNNKIIFTSITLDNQTGGLVSTIDVLIKNGSSWNNKPDHYVLYTSNNVAIYSSYFISDCSKIVYNYDINGSSGVSILDLYNNKSVKVLENDTLFNFPLFFHNENRVIYVSNKETVNQQIWIMNILDGNKKKLSEDNFNDNYFTLTSENKILFRSDQLSPHSDYTRTGNIWMMENDGGNKQLILPTSTIGYGSFSYPIMSPDGNRIYFFINSSLHYIEDPDHDGEWEDTDGDGVADIIDGAPNDPDEGYIKGYRKQDIDHEGGSDFEFYSVIILMIAMVILVLFYTIMDITGYQKKILKK